MCKVDDDDPTIGISTLFKEKIAIILCETSGFTKIGFLTLK